MADIVYVVGLGPGDPQFLTAQAQSALEEAEVLCGYPVYLDLVRPYYPEKEYYATGMTKELDRCRWALETAHSGRTVALPQLAFGHAAGRAFALGAEQGGGGARPDCRPERRRGAGCPAGP